jgi:hypothetical protein
VELKPGLMMESKIIFLLFAEWFEKIFFQQSADFVIKRVWGLRDEEGFPPVFVSNAVQGYRLELGGVQV